MNPAPSGNSENYYFTVNKEGMDLYRKEGAEMNPAPSRYSKDYHFITNREGLGSNKKEGAG